MQHQLCRNCNTRRMLAEPCNYGALPKASINKPSSINRASINVAVPSINEPIQNLGELTGATARQARWRAKHREKYNEYHREDMRRRRAANGP